MIVISHRGNINGPSPDNENSPQYIQYALQKYQCEIDVWFHDGQWFLGHDQPQYKVDQSFLEQPGLWLHAKNVDALERLVPNQRVNCFWHDTDKYTVTSWGYVWAYPNMPSMFGSLTIAVLPEWYDTKIVGYAGVCSDYVVRYQ